MPPIETELKEYLKTKTGITDIVGSGTASRIYTTRAKQSTIVPNIVFEVFEGTSEEHLTGVSGVASNRIQIDCFAESELAAFLLAEEVRLAPLQGVFAATFGTTYNHGVTATQNNRSGYDEKTAATDQRRYWVSRDYIITYQQATSLV